MTKREPEALAIGDILRENAEEQGKTRAHLMKVAGVSKAALERYLGLPGRTSIDERREIPLIAAARLATDLRLDFNWLLDEAKRRAQ